MIADLVLMVGAYIVTRMVQLLFKRESDAYIIVKIFAVATGLFTLFIMAIALIRSSEVSSLLK